MKKVFSILDTGKGRAGAAILFCVLILSLSTGMAFAANSYGNPKNDQAAQSTITTPISPEEQAKLDRQSKEEKARDYSEYAALGMTYGYAGVDYFNEHGLIEAHGVRDLTQIVHNADGSYDPSGKLIEVEPYSQAEFDARDVDKLKNPPQSLTAVHVENDTSYIVPQASQENNNTINATTADVTDNGETIKGKPFHKFLRSIKTMA